MKLADLKELAPSAFPQTTGCFSIQLRKQGELFGWGGFEKEASERAQLDHAHKNESKPSRGQTVRHFLNRSVFWPRRRAEPLQISRSPLTWRHEARPSACARGFQRDRARRRDRRWHPLFFSGSQTGTPAPEEQLPCRQQGERPVGDVEREDQERITRSGPVGGRMFQPRGQTWWEVLVTLQFVASGFVLRHPIYSRATGTLPRKKGRRKNAECRRK